MRKLNPSQALLEWMPAIALAVASIVASAANVAVAAFPVQLPELPEALPVTLPV